MFLEIPRLSWKSLNLRSPDERLAHDEQCPPVARAPRAPVRPSSSRRRNRVRMRKWLHEETRLSTDSSMTTTAGSRPPASSASATAGSRSSSAATAAGTSCGCAATSATRRRRATPARSRTASTITRTARDRLTHAAAPPRRRHVRGDRLGHRDPRGRRAARARSATRTAATSIFYYGGGGQGNHLPGAYATATRRALGSRYRSSALAQEKTGEFWVSDRMMGAITRADFEHCDVALFLGKNPWHSHSIPRARVTLKEIAARPGADADRHRSAAHRDRRARRHPPAGPARRRRLAARRDPRACSSRRASSIARSSTRHAVAARAGAGRAARGRRSRRACARAGVAEDAGAPRGARDRHGARVRQLRGSRRADEPRTRRW